MLSTQAPTRYAVRQVLDQELQKTIAMRENAARQARFRTGRNVNACADADEFMLFDDKENSNVGTKKVISEKERLRMMKLQQQQQGRNAVKKDFFGRVIVEKSAEERLALGETNGNGRLMRKPGVGHGHGHGSREVGAKVWVTFHEGLNNAVRKPITLEEFMRGF